MVTRRLVLAAACGLMPMLVLGWMAHQTALNTSLINAIERRNAAEARQLLSDGANPNATTPRFKLLPGYIGRFRSPVSYESPEPALLIASNNNDTRIVSLLLSHGANPNPSDRSLFTPLQCAVQYGNAEMARELLGHGASTASNGWGTILDNLEDGMVISHRAPRPQFYANPDFPAIASLLLDHGVNMSGRNGHGQTMLATACIFGETDTVKLLLAHGANPSNGYKPGNTPIDYARRFGHRDIVTLLRAAIARRP